MKHLKLLIAAIAAMTSLSVNAQSWKASEVAAGDFVLYNVETGQYFTSGNGWGSQASITSNASPASARTITIELYDGAYKLRTNQNGSGYGVECLNASDVYNDQSRGKNSTWTFEQVYTDNGPVYTIKSADNHKGGSDYYLTANSSNTIVSPTIDVTEYSYWKLLDAAKVPLLSAIDDYQAVRTTIVGWTTSNAVTNADEATATFNTALEAADNKVASATTIGEINEAIADLKAAGNTFLENVIVVSGIDFTNVWITNPAPGISGTLTGWTNSGTPGLANQLYEYWNVSGGTTRQTLVNLPKGAYKLTAIAYTRDGMTAYLNAGDNKVQLVGCGSVNDRAAGSTWIAGGNGVNELNFTLDAATASLVIGLTADTSTGDHWMCWRSFSLSYYGDPINLAKVSLAEAVAAAEATQGTIPTAAYNAIATVVTEKNKTYSTVEEYEAAISAINTAVSTNASAAIVAAYSRYTTVKAAALAATNNTLDTTAADEQANAATTTDAINAAIPTLRAALLAKLPELTVPAEGIDVTNALIDNPTVRQNTNYWTAEGTPNPNYSWAKVSYNECEFYQQNFDFYQNLTLNKGTWEFGVTGFHRGGQGDYNTYFYAGEDDRILIPGEVKDVVNSMEGAKTYFDEGHGKVALRFALDNASDIKIGILNQDTQTDKWTIFRDFTLKYCGLPDYSGYVVQLADAVAEFEALQNGAAQENYESYKAIVDENNKEYTSKQGYIDAIAAVQQATTDLQALIDARAALLAAVATANTALENEAPAAVKTELQTVVAENNKVYNTVSGYETATQNVTTTTTALTEVVAPYAAYKTLKAQADALVDVANDNAEANGTLATAIETADTNIETAAAITAATLEAETATLKDAMVTYVGVANPTNEDDPFNLTFMLTNPDLTNLESWQPADGWFNDQTFDPQNSQVMNTNQYVANTADPSKYAFYEYWSGENEATEGFTVYQKVNLPEGTYRMTALAVAGYGSGHRYGTQTDGDHGPGSVSVDDNKQISFSANEIDGTYIETTTLEPAYIQFEQETAGEVKIGLKAHEGNTSNWMGIGYVELFKYPAAAEEVILNENDEYDLTTAHAKANVTLTRTFNTEKWATFWVPFNISNTVLKEQFGADVKVMTVTADDKSGISFTEMATPQITANVPVLIKVSQVSANNQYTFENVVVEDAEPTSPLVEGVDFIGTYNGDEAIPANDATYSYYFVGGNELKKSTGEQRILGFRAYFRVANDSPAKAFFDSFDFSEATGIRTLDNLTIDNLTIYDLQGRRVQNPQRGIYIVNGKKVVVK